MADKRERLFSNFPAVSTEEWMSKVAVDLKGADFEKRLVWRTNEGFNLQPFYTMEDIKESKLIDALPGEFPYVRGTKKNSNAWLVRQDIVVKDIKEANKKALDLLNKGVESLSFKIDSKDINDKLFDLLLDGIVADAVELNFSTCQGHVVSLAKLFAAYVEKKKYDVKKLFGSFDFDFFNKMLTKGKEKGDFIETAKALIDAVQSLPRFRVLIVSATSLKNAGSYIVQELGYALAWGNEYLEQLTAAGVPAAVVAKRIKFDFGVSSDYFLEIGKFRAARLLWANIVAAYNPTCNHDCDNQGANGECRCASKMRVHAETAKFNLSLYDDYVNMLRTQTEAMSAGLAGVDSLTVLPFDLTYQDSTDFSERIARNQQLLLKEESHFDKVVDPAGGSYYIETVTNSIAEGAWAKFIAILEQGGFYKSVKDGLVQDDINASHKKRQLALATRRETLLGTNQFPNFNEMAGVKRPVNFDACGCADANSGIKTLQFERAGEEFEQLRLQTELSGKRPKAYMLTIGNLVMRQARAQFACNFFACAGYQVVDNLGFKTIEEGVKAALDAKADIIVLCSSDDEYAEYAEPTFKEINGRAEFVVAGSPACMDDLKAKGIEHFVHVRVNVLETLKEFNAKLLK